MQKESTVKKSLNSGRPSVVLHSSSFRSIVQEVERNFDQNSDDSTSNQQTLDLNLTLTFQEKFNDPRITSLLKKRAREGDIELTNLLQDKGLDPNFEIKMQINILPPVAFYDEKMEKF